MPELLLSPAFWKMVGGAILAVAITVAVTMFVHNYESMKAQAALVPGLQKANSQLAAQAASADASAAKAAINLILAQKQRDQAVADLAVFQKLSGQISSTLNGIAANANASKNPVCLPTDGERSLFNSAVSRFIHPNAGAGSSGTPGQVPGSAH